ncbi:HAD family hydrolase [Nostoc sp. FACHB-973]|nr:HAD family hydrolase [Nostoc sp. FACHB-973]
MAHKTFALDFDGVIADGLNECILVTWNGYYGKSLDDFSLQGLANVPDWFIVRFTQCRNFAKHLRHFAVAIFDRDTPIYTQEDYEQLYLSLDTSEVDNFTQKVNNYRANARTEKESLWLEMHTLYPNMQSFLERLEVPLYIVSAKDSASIIKILARTGINVSPKRVFGEQRYKPVALQEIQQRENLHPAEIFFLDDNIMNVIEAKEETYSAYWASWGYRAEHHLELAHQHQVTSLSLEQLSELTNIVVLN